MASIWKRKLVDLFYFRLKLFNIQYIKTESRLVKRNQNRSDSFNYYQKERKTKK